MSNPKDKQAFVPWQQTPGGGDITGTYPDAEYGEDQPIDHWWNPYFKRDMREREEGEGVQFPFDIPFKRHQRGPFNMKESPEGTYRHAQLNTSDVFPFPQDEYNEDWYDLTHGYPPTMPQDVNDITDFNPHPTPRSRKPRQEQIEEEMYEPESFRPWPLSLRKDIDLEPSETIRDRDIAWASRKKGQIESELIPGVDKIRNEDTGQIATVVDVGADWHLIRDDETGEEFFLSIEDLEDPVSTIRKVF